MKKRGHCKRKKKSWKQQSKPQTSQESCWRRTVKNLGGTAVEDHTKGGTDRATGGELKEGKKRLVPSTATSTMETLTREGRGGEQDTVGAKKMQKAHLWKVKRRTTKQGTKAPRSGGKHSQQKPSIKQPAGQRC